MILTVEKLQKAIAKLDPKMRVELQLLSLCGAGHAEIKGVFVSSNVRYDAAYLTDKAGSGEEKEDIQKLPKQILVIEHSNC